MLTPIERIRRQQEDWNRAITEFSDVLPVSIHQLRSLCEEAVIRIQAETAEDFLVAIEPMMDHLNATAELLREAGITTSVPISFTTVEHWPPRNCYGLQAHHLKLFSVWDPFTSYGLSSVRVVVGTSPDDEGVVRYWPNGDSRELLRDEIVRYLERWVRFLTAASGKLGTSSTPAAALPQTRPEGGTRTPDALTVDKVCKDLCPQRNGQNTLKQILKLTLEGKTPAEIASRNSTKRGFSQSNISEKLKLVRERFPGFLADEVR